MVEAGYNWVNDRDKAKSVVLSLIQCLRHVIQEMKGWL